MVFSPLPLILVLLWVVLFVGALFSMAKSTTASGAEKGIWILISVLVPVIGPFLWFAIGKSACQGAVTK